MVLNRLLQRIGVKEAMAARDEEREDRRIDRAEFRSEHEKMMAGVAYEVRDPSKSCDPNTISIALAVLHDLVIGRYAAAAPVPSFYRTLCSLI